MPYITVESGVLSDTQKEELIKRLTEISSEIMKIPQEFFVTTIKEVPDKNFGIGGKTIDKVKAEYMQTHNKQFKIAYPKIVRGKRLIIPGLYNKFLIFCSKIMPLNITNKLTMIMINNYCEEGDDIL